jgi:hypothetical protein
MDERYVVAAVFHDEWQASLVRETLAAEGIPCEIAGAFTGNFRAEAPGRVKLLVRLADLERAEVAIRLRKEQAQSIDWSQVDITGDHDGDHDGDPSAEPDTEPADE